MSIAQQQAQMHDAISKLFAGSASGSGEEEMLRVVSKYSKQLSARQIRVLVYLKLWALQTTIEKDSLMINQFLEYYLDLKDYNNSGGYMQQALEAVSLYRYINESAFKVDIQKGK